MVDQWSEAATVKLNDGRRMPQFGFGVYQSNPGKETYEAVKEALRIGYRHIDTAKLYGNEADVGRAVRDSGIPRDQIWITTKLWNSDHGYEAATRAALRSVEKLGTTPDLYLIHAPDHATTRKETWRALEKLREEGKLRSIGVSNYGVHHLDELATSMKVPPAVNQIELSPFFQRREIVKRCTDHGILVQAYAPLTQGKKLSHRPLKAIAKDTGGTEAQCLLAWSLSRGFIPLAKSVTPSRIEENFGCQNVKLSEEQLKEMDGWEKGFKVCWDPTKWK